MGPGGVLVNALRLAWAALAGNRLALLPWLLLAVVAVAGLSGWAGYSSGYDRAKDKYEARISGLVRDYATGEAEGERKARERLEAEQARSSAVESKYLAERRDLQSRIRTITNRRIADASSVPAAPGGVCPAGPGPEWVRLYNDALGAGRGPGDLPETAPGAPGAAGAAPAPDSGIPGADGAVSWGDVLANARDNFGRCRDSETRLLAWISWGAGLCPAAREGRQAGGRDGRN